MVKLATGWDHAIFALGDLAKTVGKLAESQAKMIQLKPYISEVSTPSEVLSDPDLPKNWTQHLKRGGVLLGDVVGGPLNVYIPPKNY